MPKIHALAFAALACVALTLAGCEEEALTDGSPAGGPDTSGCSTCHGSGDNPAPPLSLAGESDTSLPAVGAHQAHLKAGRLSGPVACDECHRVPAEYDDPGHADGETQVVFGKLATSDGATPTWDRSAGTCASTYCHGATMSGGNLKTPQWTLVNGTQAACATCHGVPPPPPHPQIATCASCHGDTVDSSGAINVAGGQHIDGQVDVVGSSCVGCHGDPGNAAPAAPPVGTAGQTATTDRAVGAHQAHLTPASWRASVQCSDCHVVPTNANHANGTVDVQLQGLAAGDSATPTYNRTTLTCSGVYCHGSTLRPAKTGGTLRRDAIWNQVDGSFKACGASCHTNPPGGDHPQNDQCATCHGEVIGPKHINGQVDL